MPHELAEVLQRDQGLNDWNILLGYRGSQAHGTYVPNDDPNSFDDIDLMGVCVPPLDHYFGLRHYGSRGTREIMLDPWDVVVYKVRKMVALLAQGNPNVLSLLWLREDHYLNVTPSGRLLIENRQVFMGKHIATSFAGYARSQLQKMTAFSFKGYMGEKRKRLVQKHGYDCKNASHLVRLLRMGMEGTGDRRGQCLAAGCGGTDRHQARRLLHRAGEEAGRGSVRRVRAGGRGQPAARAGRHGPRQ